MDVISFPSLLRHLFSEELIACIYDECNNVTNVESYLINIYVVIELN